MVSNFTRRTVLAGGLAGGIGSLIPFPEWFAANAQGPVKIRYAAQSPQGQAMVAKYSTAVQAMMGRPLGNPCGWTYQWYVHQIRSDMDKATVIAGLPAAQRPLPTEMWNTCQAHFGRPLQFFLPWHRMYVYFLERIARQACGDPNFTLPYWDYMEPTQRALPAPFRTAGPLFRTNRNGPVNAGQAIDQGDPPGTINLNCMSQTTYSGFNSAINGNPHGVVHGLVGNGQGMGSVPWAGNDSIFYFHHCNIDRYWASWNQRYANPTDAGWRNQQFVFADENCQRVLVSVKDFAALAPLGYRYDKLYRMPLTGLLADIARLRLIAVYRPLRVGPPDPGPLRIKLGNAPTTLRLVTADAKAPLANSLRSAAASRNVVLSIKNLSTSAPLDTVYFVYVNLPKGATGEKANAYFAGSISFFDAVAMDHKAMGHDGMDMGGGEGPSFDLDITALVKRLGPQADISVTILPKGRVQPDADVSVGEIELRAG